MCGIFGIVNEHDRPVDLADQQIERLRDLMESRGPDDATILRERNIVFAHRRLAIRDASGGRQPIVSANGRYVLVYNGEIYNDLELRNRLRKLGHRFQDHCDTSVLIAAWQEWEADCIPQLRGMFAFGVHDLKTQTLTLVRDRLGIKPLFYSKIDSDLVFASAVSPIINHPQFQRTPNMATLSHYLSTMRVTLDDQTVFQGLQTVRPAEIIRFCGGELMRRTYWSPPVTDKQSDLTFEEAVDQLETTLREAVSLRMNSDVPVGMMLSGGVDSNTISSLVKDSTSKSFHAVCGGGVDPDRSTALAAADDFAFAEACASYNGIDFEKEELSSEDYWAGWNYLIDHYDTPVSTPTDAVIYRIANRLKKTVGVALGGEGADEACCGYEVPHWAGNDFDLANNLNQLQPGCAENARKSLQRQYGESYFRTSGSHYLACNSLIPATTQQALFRPEYFDASQTSREVERFYDRQFLALDGISTAEKTAHVLLRTNLESLLSRLDSATMAASLESRVPYTDHILIEQLFQLPHSYRIDLCPQSPTPHLASAELSQRGQLRSKRLIHSFAGRILPEKLAKRPKASFPTPVPIWLQSVWKERIHSTVTNSRFANTLFRPEALQMLERLPPQLSMWNWPLTNLILWGEKCFN